MSQGKYRKTLAQCRQVTSLAICSFTFLTIVTILNPFNLERLDGFEPSTSGWKPDMLPLNTIDAIYFVLYPPLRRRQRLPFSRRRGESLQQHLTEALCLISEAQSEDIQYTTK